MTKDLVFDCLVKEGSGYEKLSKMNQIKMQMFFLFLSIATQRFKYKGLPDELPSWCLEKIINLYGQAVVFKVGDQYVCTQAVNSSLLNIYGEPCQVQPVALNGMSFPVVYVKDTIINNNDTLDSVIQNAVLIKNNIYSIPTYALIKPFVERLCFIWESAGINAGLSRVVALIHCNKDISGAVRSELGKMLGGTKTGIAIVSEKSGILEQIDKLDLKVEYTPDKYWQDFDNTFNMICQLVGITTDMNKNKKERVVVAQVESNDEVTSLIEHGYAKYRELACEELNRVFGLNVELEQLQDIKVTNPNDYQPFTPKNEPPTT